MKNTMLQKDPTSKTIAGKQYSYNEIVEFLDSHWQTNLTDTSHSAIKQLNKALGDIATQMDTIVISGSNGKSLTTHFAAKLLKEEGLKVGALSSPHILTYNERFTCSNETISNKIFTDIGNEVICTAQNLGVQVNTRDILLMMALMYFKSQNADIAIVESNSDAACPTAILQPKLIAITRITDVENCKQTVADITKQMLSPLTAGAHVVSADQSKLNLQTMQHVVTDLGGSWSMPIRKLAPLSYPFEQLHGRCAALAERISQIYANSLTDRETVFVSSSLLTKQKGQRGRPTLEAKRQSELNPKKTIEQFWKEVHSSLTGRFQLLDKEKPSILLDTASTLDAFKNLLLGIRLLHYQRPLKGLTLILGSDNKDLDVPELLKLLRYFFKKTSGQVIVCPAQPVPGNGGSTSWDPEKVTNDIKSMKIKAKSCRNFKEAFELAQKSVDERHGLVVVAGSPSMITEYWKNKGMKKL